MRRIANKDHQEAFVPQDSAEVFMLDFIATEFTTSGRLRVKTSCLVQDVLDGNTMPELEQFVGDDEAGLIITGLKQLVTFGKRDDWRTAQANLMLAEYEDPEFRARSLAKIQDMQTIAEFEKEFQS